MEAAGAVDAPTASTAPWKTKSTFSTAPTGRRFVNKLLPMSPDGFVTYLSG
jgi:hypothetical protein